MAKGPRGSLQKLDHLVQLHLHFQERLAPSAVTHRISTLHPYNTRQQTHLAGQQLNICEAMPGKLTPAEDNCDCEQAVMDYLKAAAVTVQLECADAANVNMQMQTLEAAPGLIMDHSCLQSMRCFVWQDNMVLMSRFVRDAMRLVGPGFEPCLGQSAKLAGAPRPLCLSVCL